MSSLQELPPNKAHEASKWRKGERKRKIQVPVLIEWNGKKERCSKGKEKKPRTKNMNYQIKGERELALGVNGSISNQASNIWEVKHRERHSR